MRLSVAIALFHVLKMCVIVEGLYQVEVRLIGYDNPTQRCLGCPLVNGFRSCCDDFTRNDQCTSGGRCDSVFIYCLRPFGSEDSQLGGGCPNRLLRIRSIVNSNDGAVDFSQRMVFGLDNPLLLQGLTNDYTEVQLYIEVQDSDGGDNPLIDTLLINLNRTVEMPQRRNYGGIHGFVTMDLNITVFCVENFGGADCSRCVSGFTGPDCQTVDYCVGVDCGGNGVCVNGIDSFICNCSAGYTGSECENDIDDCFSSPCTENSQCVAGVDSFICNCDQGFTGLLCETNIDDCNGVDCSGNGECVDGVDSFTCICSAGYSGHLCHIIEAQQSPNDALQTIGTITGASVGVMFVVILLLIFILTFVCWIKKNNTVSDTSELKLKDNIPFNKEQQLKERDNASIHFHTEENVAYGQTTSHVLGDEDIMYSQTTPHISTEGKVAYGQTTPRISTEENIAYVQTTPHISTEGNVAYGQTTPYIPEYEEVAYCSIK